MEEIFNKIIDEGLFFWFVGGTVALVAILSSAVRGTISSVSRERTRREIAAYIAEGSMTPEQGERLMKAGGDDKKSCC